MTATIWCAWCQAEGADGLDAQARRPICLDCADEAGVVVRMGGA